MKDDLEMKHFAMPCCHRIARMKSDVGGPAVMWRCECGVVVSDSMRAISPAKAICDSFHSPLNTRLSWAQTDRKSWRPKQTADLSLFSLNTAS